MDHPASDPLPARENPAARDSASALELALASGGLGTWDWNLLDDSFRYSARARAICGFAPAPAPLDLDDVRRATHPDDYPLTLSLARRALDPALREEVSYDYRVVRPDGEVRWVVAHGAAVFALVEGVERAVRYVGTIQDVTEHRRLGQALEASEARLKLAQQAANIGIWDWDVQTGAIAWTPEMYALLGLDPQRDMADPYAAWLDVLHPDDRQGAHAAAQLAARQGRSVANDFRIVLRGSDDVRWIRSHAHMIAGDDGQPARVIGVNLDVTDLHRQQEALRDRNRALERSADQSRRERERVFEMSQDLFAALGFDGFLKVINPAWSRLLGYSEAALLRRPLLELVHADHVAASSRLVEAMRRGDTAHRFTDRLRDADGAYQWITWTANCDGELIYLVGRDVTAERRANDALEVANRDLLRQVRERERVEQTLHQVQRLEAVGQLTAGVAHDFNNLLTVILGNIEIAARASDDPQMRKRLGLVRQAAERGAALTAQLLAFSRRQRLEPRPVNLNDTVEGMGALLKSTMGGSVQLDIVLTTNAWSALVDPTQIEMIILNLAINARDAMPVGGRLTIAARNAVLTELPQHPGEPAPGEYVELSVADTGAGMDEAVRARAFEPFFTTKGVGKGSGLGLPQVLGFAQQSGGGVRIDSAPGQGTTVRVYLPRATGGAAAAAGEAPSPAAAVHEGRERLVVLVDDDEYVREITAINLRDMGFAVLECGSGEAALDLLARHPDVALLVADFAMPGMNGAELARQARRERSRLPVLFVTGYADQSALADIDDRHVVQKPFGPDELQRKVLAALAPAAVQA